MCKFFGSAQAVYADYGGVVLGSAMGEGEAIAKALGPQGKGAILANHGLLTVGSTVDEAGYLFQLLDKSCRIQMDLAMAGVEPVVIADREAEFNFRMESRSVSLASRPVACLLGRVADGGDRTRFTGNSSRSLTMRWKWRGIDLTMYLPQTLKFAFDGSSRC